MTIADSMREIAIESAKKLEIEELNHVLLLVDNEVIPSIKEHAKRGRFCVWWSFRHIERAEIAKRILEEYGFACKRNNCKLLIKW